MNNLELSIEDQVYYGNYGRIEVCDCCGNYQGIINYHESGNFIEICENGCHFQCQKCIR